MYKSIKNDLILASVFYQHCFSILPIMLISNTLSSLNYSRAAWIKAQNNPYLPLSSPSFKARFLLIGYPSLAQNLSSRWEGLLCSQSELCVHEMALLEKNPLTLTIMQIPNTTITIPFSEKLGSCVICKLKRKIIQWFGNLMNPFLFTIEPRKHLIWAILMLHEQ